MIYCVEVSAMGDRIRIERKSLGLNQDEFAELCGLSRDGVSKLEGGSTKPLAETLFRISQATGRSMEYFISGSCTERESREIKQAASLAQEASRTLRSMARKLYELGGVDMGVAVLKVAEKPPPYDGEEPE